MFWNKEKAPAAIQIKVIEVEKPRTLVPVDRDTLATLQHHPGFVFLLGKLRTQRNYFESLLKNQKHESIREVDYLQGAIYWSNWLEMSLNKELSGRQTPQAQADPLELELAAFEQAKQALEMIGQ